MKKLIRILIRSVVLSVVLVVCAGFGLHWYQVGPKWVSTENAYVKTKMIAISADVDGRVDDVMVANNQFVSEGQLLFEIESEPFEIELASKDAELNSIEQRINNFKAVYKLAQLETLEAEEKVRFYESEYQRHNKLDGTHTKAQQDQARHNVEMAKVKVSLMRQKSAMALTDLGGDPDLPLDKHPLYLKAKAVRDRAERDLGLTSVFSPSSGYLSNVNLEPGEFVESGEPIFSLISATPPWIEANLKESQLTHIQVGQSATIEIDAYPDFEWQATISSISRATGAEFALLPPQNATGNWVKVVQRIPVRLAVESNPLAPALRAGMTATVSIDTEQERDVLGLLDDIMGSATAMGSQAKSD